MRDLLLRNALHLLANSGVTMGLGFFFWWLAAHVLPPSEVGIGTALTSAMLLLGLVSKLGFEVTLIRIIPQTPRGERSVILDSFAWTSALLAVALGVGFVAATRALDVTFARALADPLPAALFVAGVVAVAELLVFEGLFLAEERASLVTWKNGAVAAGKVILVVPLAFAGGAGIVGAWGIASITIALVVATWVALTPEWGWRPRPRIDGGVLARSGRLNAGNFLSQTADFAPMYLFPILVAQFVGERDAGFFYIAWMLALVIDFVPIAATTSLLASASRSDEGRERKVRHALAFTAALVVPACVVGWVFGHVALGAFGSEYAEHATGALRVLVLAVPLVALNRFLVNLLRTRDRTLAFTAFAAGLAALAVALVVPFSQWGIAGVAWAWFAANAVFAVIALPGVVNEARGRGGSVGGGRRGLAPDAQRTRPDEA